MKKTKHNHNDNDYYSSGSSFVGQWMKFFMIALLSSLSSTCTVVHGNELTCSLGENMESNNMHEFHYDIGYGDQMMMAYVEPDIKEFYQNRDTPPASTKVVPKHKGLAGKFINMSNKPIRMYWEAYEGSDDPSLMNYIAPFESAGTATFTGHYFFFATQRGDPTNPKNVLKRWIVGKYPENNYYYDPYEIPNDPEATKEEVKRHLTIKEQKLYQQWRDTLNFSNQYYNFTGRSYIANYLRKTPQHYIWNADYFDQEHWITTYETHFTSLPPENKLKPITVKGKRRVLQPSDKRLLHEYRDQSTGGVMNMTLKVLSVAPKVFEIPNFLSTIEIDHILQLAGNITLSRSSVGDIGSGQSKSGDSKSNTRTSFNSWVPREKSPIIDSIYRRAGDLLRIDEALLRGRDKGEFDDRVNAASLAEHLQLVHYDPGQEYTAHHDFGFNELDEHQGTRFATLLLYLNDEGLIGGETSFPRWVNAETFDQLKVPPKAGKAVLFYSQLPDGNLDDFSHHAALPVKEGEKWLINLWVWDPVYK